MSGPDKKNIALIDNLLKLLRQLNFSEVHIEENPAYPNPDRSYFEKLGIRYIPSISARKNSVNYYFEIVTEEMLKSPQASEILQVMACYFDDSEDIDLILISEYGDRERVNKWCKDYNIDALNVWEF